MQDDLVSAYAQSGGHADAIEILIGRIKETPDGDGSADQHLVLGDLYTKIGDSTKALESYTRAVAINPIDGSVQMMNASPRNRSNSART